MESLKKLLEKARSFAPMSKEYILDIYQANTEEFEVAWEKLISNPKNQEFCSLLKNGLYLQWEDWPKHYIPAKKITLYARAYQRYASKEKVACLKVMAKKH